MSNPAHSDLSLRVAKALSESDTPRSLLAGALRVVAEALDWDTGNVWRVDYENVQMSCIGSWTRDGLRFPHFEDLCEARKFQHGEGIPGAVWKTKQALWMEQVSGSDNFPRLSIAALEGVVSAAAVPICIERRVVGCMEFFSRQRRSYDAGEVEAMEAAATQIAAYLERLRLEEGLTGARAEFEMLAEKSFDAIVTIDENSTILFANTALTTIFGYARYEIVGKNLCELIPPHLREQHRLGMERYLRTGRKNLTWDGIVLPALHRSGLQFRVEVRFGEINQGGRRFFTGYMRPVPAT